MSARAGAQLSRINVGERRGGVWRRPGARRSDRFVDTAMRGVAGGFNVALRNAHGPQLVLCALDRILAPDVLELAGIAIFLRIALKMPAHTRGFALDQEWTL